MKKYYVEYEVENFWNKFTCKITCDIEDGLTPSSNKVKEYLLKTACDDKGKKFKKISITRYHAI